jgi:hypothetical protein
MLTPLVEALPYPEQDGLQDIRPRALTHVPLGPDAHNRDFQRQFEFVVARRFDRPP